MRGFITAVEQKTKTYSDVVTSSITKFSSTSTIHILNKDTEDYAGEHSH